MSQMHEKMNLKRNRNTLSKNISKQQVKSIKVAQHEKQIRFVKKGDAGAMPLPRFAPVGPNDILFFSGVRNQKIWLESDDEKGKKIFIRPVFNLEKQLKLGGRRLHLTIKEIESKEEYEAYIRLERFHYRSNPSLIEQEEDVDRSGGGRKSVLLASLQIGKRITYVGYIELTMPLMMVAPRHRAFDKPFSHSVRKINWAKWDQNALRENLNLIVRISRVVTHPTFRGIGLSHILVDASEDYAKERWHIGRRAPIFIEISAEMLNYFDFVSGCGFTYCGHTEGNQKRIAKDMRQMARGQKISSGIMTLQNRYFSVLQIFAELENISIEKAIKRVEEIADSEDPESCVSDESWIILRKLFRQPRPYFVKGLDRDASKYLKNISVPNPKGYSERIRKVNPRVEIEKVVLKAKVNLPKSKHVKVIKDAFGLEGGEVKQTLLALDKFGATQGNVFLLAGASGTGKSIFLDMLAYKDKGIHDNVEITYKKFEIGRTACLGKIGNEAVLIDYFANKYGLSRSLKTLAIVGLSEAMPLVKPFWMLSKGQKYRALLADLLLQEADVWLLDEFGADLDPVTASVLAGKLRKLADRYGVIIFVAAANNGHFFNALRPSRVITFDLGEEPKIKTVMEYKNELL